MPKTILFSMLCPRCPPGGPRKRWRDCVRSDLQSLGTLSAWYETAQSRSTWRALYQDLTVPSRLVSNAVCCRLCRREFSRPSDFKRHKCLAERLRPIQEQRGAVQCGRCQLWFRSSGGLAVHSCHPTDIHVAVATTSNPLPCSTCLVFLHPKRFDTPQVCAGVTCHCRGPRNVPVRV